MKYSEETKRKVLKDISEGMTYEDAMRKYSVSDYYIRLWTKNFFKKCTIQNYVRYRYRHIVCDLSVKMGLDIANVMRPTEINSISDETWDKVDGVLKSGLYNLAEQIKLKEGGIVDVE